MLHTQVCQWFIAPALLLSIAFAVPPATASPEATENGELWITSQGTSTGYMLDLTTDTLTDRGTLGVADWHSFNMTADGRRGFGTSPLSDEVILIDLTTQPVTKLRTVLLQPLSGTGNNQPDSIGYEPVVGNLLPVALRAAGQLALINLADLAVKFVPISPPTSFDPKTCAGCAIHGVTIRPRTRPGR